MGSNLHNAHCDEWWPETSQEHAIKRLWNSSSRRFIPPALVSGWGSSRWAGDETATPRETEEVSAFRPDGSKTKSRNSNYWRHPCAFYKTLWVQNTALLWIYFNIFIYPLLKQNHPATPEHFKEWILLLSQPCWLLKIPSEQLSVLHIISTFLQTTDLAQLSQQGHLSPRGSVCNEEMAQDTRRMPQFCKQRATGL